MNRQNREIDIDKSRQAAERTFLKCLRDAVGAVFMGAIFFQVMLFAFTYIIPASSIVLWYDNPIFITYLIICGILGWLYGEKFIETLSRKSADWWDLWNHWRF